MKTINRIYNGNIKPLLLFVIVFGVMAIGCISCDKPITEEPEDYREKWVGSYECEEIWGYLSTEDPDTIVIREQVLQVIIDVKAKGDFIFNFSQKGTDMSYDVKINTDGSFWDYSSFIPAIQGYFVDDSLFIDIIHRNTKEGRSDYKGKKRKSVKQ